MLDNLSPQAKDWVEALIILVGFWAPALILRLLWQRLLAPWINRSKHPNLARLIRPLRTLAVWTLVLSGLNFAFQSLDFADENPALATAVQKGLSIAWIVLAIIVLSRLTAGFFYYQARRNAKEHEEIRERTSTAQKLATGATIVIGAIFALQVAGIDVSPLLAGGAVGGLIIGLALQDSLSNVFAGLFINMDRPIQVGDLLRFSDDQEGFVEEVGWRYTKVRLWNESMLMIPNSKFSQSSFINFDRPVYHVQVYVNCGVAYDSDLDHVERVAIAAGKAAQNDVNDEADFYEPVVRWRGFDDSSIPFRLICRADHATKQYLLASECIKQIHRRFKEEGINIPFPIRTVYMHQEKDDEDKTSEEKSSPQVNEA